jgi:hypothetical protein
MTMHVVVDFCAKQIWFDFPKMGRMLGISYPTPLPHLR